MKQNNAFLEATEHTNSSAQLGNNNEMKVNIGQNASSTFFIGQFGNENKMIFHLEDHRGYEVTTSGAGEKNYFNKKTKCNTISRMRHILFHFCFVNHLPI